MTKTTKNKKNHHNGGGNHAPEVKVGFKFTHPTATAVFVAGTFNEWRPAATPMTSIGDALWFKQIVLPPGRYEYCLVVDEMWMPDPLAKESVPNPFGGLNSVIQVPAPD